jgi:hypothetical protein
MNEVTPITPEPPRRKIWLAIPTYGGTVTVGTLQSMVHDMVHLIIRGDVVRPCYELGHADIYLLRAQIVANFLADTEATDLVMIDSDVAWDSFGLVKLLEHDVDVVAGAYPKREDPLTFMYRSEITINPDTCKPQKAIHGDPQTGLCEVWGVPGGFLRIKRHVLEQMVEYYGPELTCFDPTTPNKKTVRLFDPLWWRDDDGVTRTLSEDYAFCQRWRDLGGKVYLDVNIPMAHVGTKVFHGCLGNWVQPKPQEEQAA